MMKDCLNTSIYIKSIHNQQGVALLVVLWIISMMLVIASGMMYSVKTESGMTGYARYTAQARAHADSALRYAIAQLALPSSERQLKTTGSPHQWLYEGIPAEISVIGENGLIDLNRANKTLLLKVLEQIGVVEQEADTLIDAIQDFSDADDLKRLNGAEDRDYEQAGFVYGAKDAPFERIEELQQVMGMTPQIYEGLKQYFTLNSLSSGVNPMVAPRKVLMLLANGDAAQVEAYIAEREASEGEFIEPSFSSEFFDRNQLPNYRIQIRVALEPGAPPYFEERAIRLIPGKIPPFISYFRVMQKLDKRFL